MESSKPKGLKGCNNCTRAECDRGYPKGIPPYCLAKTFHDIVDETKAEYSAPDVIDIFKTSVRVASNGYGRWTRIQEAIEFARELKLSKIGFASCTAVLRELGMITKLFEGAGFETISVICQIGRVSPEARGVTFDSKDLHGHYCNPIAQAEILNRASTDLNFALGLCLGHDILFTRYSKAPVSTLIVKDRVTGHNPSAALYSAFHYEALQKLYCGQEEN